MSAVSLAQKKDMMIRTMLAGMAAVRRFGWLPLSVFMAHEVCAHVVDGYRLWPSVDIPLHFFGSLAIPMAIKMSTHEDV